MVVSTILSANHAQKIPAIQEIITMLLTAVAACQAILDKMEARVEVRTSIANSKMFPLLAYTYVHSLY